MAKAPKSFMRLVCCESRRGSDKHSFKNLVGLVETLARPFSITVMHFNITESTKEKKSAGTVN